MNDEIPPGVKANMRLDHINGDLKDIKDELSTQNKISTQIQIEMSSLRTEVRIIGSLVIAAVITLIGLYISHLAG